MIADPVACRVEPRVFVPLAFDGTRLAPAWPLGDWVGGQGAEQFGPDNCKNPSMILRLFRSMPPRTEHVSVGTSFHCKQAVSNRPSPHVTPSRTAEKAVNLCNLLKPCNLCNQCNTFNAFGSYLQNAEYRQAGQSHPKPHQCDIKATPKRVDSQPIATPKPP
jgi:hypothetical protein